MQVTLTLSSLTTKATFTPLGTTTGGNCACNIVVSFIMLTNVFNAVVNWAMEIAWPLPISGEAPPCSLFCFCCRGPYCFMSPRTNSNVELPPGLKIASASCGQTHNVALTTTGRVVSWGSGALGQLGHGSTSDRLHATMIRALLSDSSPVISVSCGANHTVAVTEEGDVYSWGWVPTHTCCVILAVW
jgi:Regulator of chromosome condensation (RCC1) repeat